MATSLFPAPPLACLDPKCPANDTTVAASFTGRSFYYRRSPCCLSIQEPPDAPADDRVEVVALLQAPFQPLLAAAACGAPAGASTGSLSSGPACRSVVPLGASTHASNPICTASCRILFGGSFVGFATSALSTPRIAASLVRTPCTVPGYTASPSGWQAQQRAWTPASGAPAAAAGAVGAAADQAP